MHQFDKMVSEFICYDAIFVYIFDFQPEVISMNKQSIVALAGALSLSLTACNQAAAQKPAAKSTKQTTVQSSQNATKAASGAPVNLAPNSSKAAEATCGAAGKSGEAGCGAAPSKTTEASCGAATKSSEGGCGGAK